MLWTFIQSFVNGQAQRFEAEGLPETDVLRAGDGEDTLSLSALLSGLRQELYHQHGKHQKTCSQPASRRR